MIKVPINRRGAPMCAPESLLTAAGITSDRGSPHLSLPYKAI